MSYKGNVANMLANSLFIHPIGYGETLYQCPPDGNNSKDQLNTFFI